MDNLLNVPLVKKQEIHESEAKNKLGEKKEESVDRVLKTRRQSKLFASHYIPEQHNGDPYKQFGFAWPRKEDLVNLMVEYDIQMKDLILEKVQWKREGCGFSMIQLVFKGGITSPAFKVKDCDEEDFVTSNINQSKKVNFVKVRVCDNKIVENMFFLTDKVADPKPDHILGKVEPCRCGEDEWLELNADQHIVGLYGITSNEDRSFDNIRGIGFITMNINA